MAEEDGNKGCMAIIAIIGAGLLSSGAALKSCTWGAKSLITHGDDVARIGAHSVDNLASSGAHVADDLAATGAHVADDFAGTGSRATDDLVAAHGGHQLDSTPFVLDEFHPSASAAGESSAHAARLAEQADQTLLQHHAAQTGTRRTLDAAAEHADDIAIEAADVGLNIYDYWADDDAPEATPLATSQPPDALSSPPWAALPGEVVTSQLIAQNVKADLPVAVSAPRVIAVIPDQVLAYRRMFSALPDSAQYTILSNTRERYKGDGHTTVLSDSSRKRQLFQILTDGENDSNTTVVFAFRSPGESGDSPREFRLPSGETVSVTEMQQVALDAETQCILVACPADALESAVQAREIINKAVDACGQAAARDQQVLMRTFVETLRRERAALSAAGVTITVMSPGATGRSVYSISSNHVLTQDQ